MTSSSKRDFDQIASSTTVQGRASKQRGKEDASSVDDHIDAFHRDKRISIRAEYDGVGIQNCGTGSVQVRGDVFIGTSTSSHCLADLRSTDPRDDKRRIESSKGGLFKDSYRWVLDNPDFLAWQNGTERHLLWIKGDPGKGKTMLLCGIIDRLKHDLRDTTIAFFFCQAADARFNNATAVLRGLLYLLIVQKGHLISNLLKKYDIAGRALFEDINASFALSGILVNMLKDPMIGDVCFVVDAIDECEFDRDRLLELIVHTQTEYPVRWIVSSRNLPNIEEKLRSGPSQVGLSLELNHVHVADAVQKYIRYKVERLTQSKQYTLEIKNEVEQYLGANADDTFLWVALVCQELDNISAWRAPERVKTFPQGLYALYHRMMDQVQASSDVDLCKQILAILAVTYRPITLDELYHLMDLPDGFPRDIKLLEELIRLCGSFLGLREHTVYFVHQSAKDFLHHELAPDIHPGGISQEHIRIYLRSLHIMSNTLQRDLYQTGDPGLTVDELHPPEPSPLSSSRYSCIFCIDHLCDAISGHTCVGVLPDENQITNFLQNSYLKWLEALALLGELGNGLSSLSRLSAILQETKKGTEAATLVEDALRFVRYYKPCIEKYPLQVYVSALVFSPLRSFIRTAYSREQPQWMARMPVVEDDWGACLQTLEAHDHPVVSVACSLDGKLIASCAITGSIIIWDASSGTVVQSLDAKSRYTWVHPIAFSPNSRTLAYGFEAHSIKLWNVETRCCTQPFNSHPGVIRSIAFSPDGRTLASACLEMVYIWDIATGICVRKLEGHLGGVNVVTFSYDGLAVASGSDDHAIKIWNVADGACTQTLEGHDDPVQSVTFSPEGYLIASGSLDQTAKIWVVTTGACAQTFEGHTHMVHSVVFSPDGQTLASGSTDYTIKIWNVTTGACVTTFVEHRGSINSLGYLPNGPVLASGSADCTIKIWDMSQVTPTRYPTDRSRKIDLITLSHDGEILALSDHDTNTIEIWQSATGAHVRTLSGHRFEIESVMTSRRGTQVVKHTGSIKSIVFLNCDTLISISDSGCIQLWDVNIGFSCPTPRYIWRGCRAHMYEKCMKAAHFEILCVRDACTFARILSREASQQVPGVGFLAQNGLRLLAGSCGRAIRIWDLATGDCLLEQDRKSWDHDLALAFEHLPCPVSRTLDLSDYGLEPYLCHVSGEPHLEMAARPQGSTQPSDHGYGIASSGVWVTRNRQKIMWLPPEYRPWRSAAVGTTLAIASEADRLLILQLSLDPIV